MTFDDRDLLHALRRQQEELQRTLERINVQLVELEQRAGPGVTEIPAELPPLPLEALLPPIPPHAAETPPALDFPPLPPVPFDAVPPPPPPMAPDAPGTSIEHHFGRWLVGIGAFFGVVVLALTFALPKVQAFLGHAGLLGVSAGASIVVVILAERLELNGGARRILGRSLLAMALVWLYLTTYAATAYEPLHVITNPLIGGVLLFIWSLYVLRQAERKKSQFLALFSITLAYVSTALNPMGAFTMAADLLLAATSVVFLLRNGWAALAYFSLIGTYVALLRRLVIDEYGEFVLDTRGTLSFWPHAVYLLCAWLMFTAATILANARHFRGAKRLIFLSLNNAAVAGLMGLSAYVCGYGASAVGWTMIDTGVIFLFTSRFAEIAEIEPVEVMGAYGAQGLALITGGVMLIYTGVARAVILLVETLLLGIGAAFSGDRILAVTTYVTASFATLFLVWEIAGHSHHPWLLGFGGALVMLINAWSSRGEVRNSPMARSSVVVSTSCYCILALGLIYAALSTALDDNMLAPALAVTALVLTFAIYQVALFELPPLAQILMLIAQVLILFPTETGVEIPWQSTAWVAVITLLLVTWCSRQRVTRSGAWAVTITFLYALALAGMAHQEIRPYLDAQGWIVGASLLSLGFLVYGAFSRVWAMAAVGQIFLALAVYHLFFPPNRDVFPWAWWAAAAPIVVILATARAAHEWLRIFREIPDAWRKPLSWLAYGYQLLAVAALCRWVFGVIPAQDQVAAFFFLGTLVLSMSVRRPSAFGVRCSFILSAVGMLLYFETLAAQAHEMATFLNGFAVVLFLAQAGLLRHEGRYLVTPVESWAHIVFSSLTGWVFVSAWVWTRSSPGHLTMGWALYALFLFGFGLLVREKRLRWCGLAVVLAAIVRLLCSDMWHLGAGYRVLTFIVLALITLGLGFGLLRRSAPGRH